MTQPLLGTLWQFFVERKRDRKKEEEFCFGTFLVTKKEGPERRKKIHKRKEAREQGEGHRRRRKRIRNKDKDENMTFILSLLGDQVNRLNPFLILE